MGYIIINDASVMHALPSGRCATDHEVYLDKDKALRRRDYLREEAGNALINVYELSKEPVQQDDEDRTIHHEEHPNECPVCGSHDFGVPLNSDAMPAPDSEEMKCFDCGSRWIQYIKPDGWELLEDTSTAGAETPGSDVAQESKQGGHMEKPCN